MASVVDRMFIMIVCFQRLVKNSIALRVHSSKIQSETDDDSRNISIQPHIIYIDTFSFKNEEWLMLIDQKLLDIYYFSEDHAFKDEVCLAIIE